MRSKAKKTLLFLMVLFMVSGSPACKAKSCDTSNNIDGEGGGKKRKKNLGLFSKKEMRKRRWR